MVSLHAGVCLGLCVCEQDRVFLKNLFFFFDSCNEVTIITRQVCNNTKHCVGRQEKRGSRFTKCSDTVKIRRNKTTTKRVKTQTFRKKKEDRKKENKEVIFVEVMVQMTGVYVLKYAHVSVLVHVSVGKCGRAIKKDLGVVLVGG